MRDYTARQSSHGGWTVVASGDGGNPIYYMVSFGNGGLRIVSDSNRNITPHGMIGKKVMCAISLERSRTRHPSYAFRGA